MPHHPADGFNGYTITEANERGKTMPGHVCGQILFDAAEVRNLLQVAVCLLIADNRKASPLFKTYRV